MAAVFAELAKAQPRRQFTVGINDDVTNLSLDYDADFSTEADDVTRAVFFGLGSDGTVSANRSSVKIIGENTPRHAQGYFVYDSRKAGSVTTSHVRFSPRPIKGSYLVHKANFVACHQFHFTERIDMLSMAVPGATFLLNSPYGPDEVWDHLPRRSAAADHRQEAASSTWSTPTAWPATPRWACGSTPSCRPASSSWPTSSRPRRRSPTSRTQIKKTYGKKGGGTIVQRNNAAVDGALAALHEVKRARPASRSKLRTWCRRCRPTPRRSSRTCWA